MLPYDLTREGWIPMLSREGERREDWRRNVSLREALTEAHRFREVRAGSPLETVALYRLLQALALRIFADEMSDINGWFDLFEGGRFPAERVRAYFDQWQDKEERFDLLHADYPFYQHPEPLTEKTSALGKLFAAESSGNNATLFGHELDEAPRRLPLSAAARGLLATQSAALGGGHSKPFYFSSAPLAGGAVFWMRGRSLFEALLLNSPPSEKGRMNAFPDEESRPVWEREKPYAAGRKRAETGYLDYLTWPSRRLLLETEESNDGTPLASGVRISQGDKKEGGAGDPLMAYDGNEKTGLFPFKMDKDRAVWRDANVFFRRFGDEMGGAPPALSWVIGESNFEPALERRAWTVDVFGFVNDQAKMELWRHERLPFYPSILRNGERYERLAQAVDRAERQSGLLEAATRAAAAKLLFPGKEEDDLARQEREKMRDLARSLGAQTRFWAHLEAPFFAWLDDLAADEYDARRLPARWLQTLHREARDAYHSATASFDASGRHLRARTAGDNHLYPAASYRDDLKATPDDEVPA
jgi:CRISPR system Cascade subunit CasA